MSGNDLIINLAPTGMVPTRADSAHVPLSVDQIVEDVCRCAEAGVAMVHLHARDGDGAATCDPGVYARLIEGIRRHHPELVIVVSTSGRVEPDFTRRAAVLDLDGAAKPDMASLTLGSMNFASGSSVTAPDTLHALLERMHERQIVPELEVFDLGMLNYARVLDRRGLLPRPAYLNVLLGNIASAQVAPAHIAAVVADLPDGACWSLAGFGRFQLAANTAGLLFADGVRVGLEDNLWFDDARRVPATNLALVERVRQLAGLLDRLPATAAAVRRRLGLAPQG